MSTTPESMQETGRGLEGVDSNDDESIEVEHRRAQEMGSIFAGGPYDGR